MIQSGYHELSKLGPTEFLGLRVWSAPPRLQLILGSGQPLLQGLDVSLEPVTQGYTPYTTLIYYSIQFYLYSAKTIELSLLVPETVRKMYALSIQCTRNIVGYG